MARAVHGLPRWSGATGPAVQAPPGQGCSVARLAPDTPGFQVTGGDLICHGNAFRRFALPIAAPFVVRFTVRYDDGFGWLSLGLCDDGFGSRIDISPFGSLSIVDKSTGVVGGRQGKLEIEMGKAQKLEVRHDGERVTSSLNGAKASEIVQVGSRTAGYITLFVHSNKVIRISELTIEGAVDRKKLDAFRSAWVKARMARLFRSR